MTDLPPRSPDIDPHQQPDDRPQATEETAVSPHLSRSPGRPIDALVEVKLYETELAARSPANPHRSLPYSSQQ